MRGSCFHIPVSPLEESKYRSFVYHIMITVFLSICLLCLSIIHFDVKDNVPSCT